MQGLGNEVSKWWSNWESHVGRRLQVSQEKQDLDSKYDVRSVNNHLPFALQSFLTHSQHLPLFDQNFDSILLDSILAYFQEFPSLWYRLGIWRHHLWCHLCSRMGARKGSLGDRVCLRRHQFLKCPVMTHRLSCCLLSLNLTSWIYFEHNLMVYCRFAESRSPMRSPSCSKESSLIKMKL